MRRPLGLGFVVAVLSCSDAAPPPPVEPVALEAVADPDASTACLAVPPAAGRVRAKHVVCEEELLSGSVVLGRVGDLVLENARARFFVRGGEHSATVIGSYAGGLVDAAPVGGADLVKEILPGVDLSSGRPDAIVVTAAGSTGVARVRVLFTAAPLGLLAAAVPGLSGTVRMRGAIDYELRPDESALRISVHLTTQEGVPAAQGRPMLLALIGGAELLQPYREVLADDTGSGGAGRAVLLGENERGAFALRILPDQGAVSHVLSINVVQGGERVTVREGELSSFEALLGVGHTAADAFGAVHPEEDLATLVVRGVEGDRVEVADAEGAPIVRTRLPADGASLRLPPGSYRARGGFASFFGGSGVMVELPAGGASVDVPPAPRGSLAIAATAGGVAAPVAVTVEEGGEVASRAFVLGSGALSLPPGTYGVTISRGMEHTVHREDVVLADGGEVAVTAALDRVVDTSGWVAGDFHLHTEMSTDSTQPAVEKLRQMAAEGLEVVASTDHDFVHDYRPLLEEAGVAPWLVAVPGAEVSTTVFGHIGGYPLLYDRALAGAGAPVWFDGSPAEVFARIRARGDASLGGAVVQLHHPRFGGAAFFTAVGLDRATGRATASPASLGLPGDVELDDFDFDVIEAWNGISSGDNEETLLDVLALWEAGRRFPMVGNSDTHEARSPPGTPRTYLRVLDDAAGAFGWEEVAGSLRAGRSTIAAGIFVTAEVAGAVSGDVVPLAVRVQAPPWASVDRVRVYAGAAVAVERAIDPDLTDPVRLDETIDVPLGAAEFVLVRADGSAAPRPLLRRAPFGLTNPILVR